MRRYPGRGAARPWGSGQRVDRVVSRGAPHGVRFTHDPEIWGTCLLLAVDGEDLFGYLLGFQHRTFFANGQVACVKGS